MRRKLLYATGNPAKMEAMRKRLESLDIEVIGLWDVKKESLGIFEAGGQDENVIEDGITPLENAEKKAHFYYKQFQMPLFSCDSGLYIEGIPSEEQPGVHVRNIHGKCLTDEEMQEYYMNLAGKYGDLKARYRNAICLVLDEGHIYSAMEENMASEPFLITARPHKKGILKKGFPLDCLSVDIKTGKYYYDLVGDELEQVAVEDGFLTFFKRCLNLENE